MIGGICSHTFSTMYIPIAKQNFRTFVLQIYQLLRDSMNPDVYLYFQKRKSEKNAFENKNAF